MSIRRKGFLHARNFPFHLRWIGFTDWFLKWLKWKTWGMVIYIIIVKGPAFTGWFLNLRTRGKVPWQTQDVVKHRKLLSLNFHTRPESIVILVVIVLHCLPEFLSSDPRSVRRIFEISVPLTPLSKLSWCKWVAYTDHSILSMARSEGEVGRGLVWQVHGTGKTSKWHRGTFNHLDRDPGRFSVHCGSSERVSMHTRVYPFTLNVLRVTCMQKHVSDVGLHGIV